MEAEEKGMVPESQAGFRKGRSTVDNIFVLNHLIQKIKGKGGKVEKVYALFADLKAAFDNVDKEILWRILQGKGIKEQLIRRLEKIYDETEVVVRTSHGYTEEFQTSKGVRQGCVMSLLLFNLYVADLAEVMKKRGIGGIEVDKIRVWNSEYADDIVMVARNRDALIDMMSTMKRFLKERKLELCTDKTKIVVFNSKRKEGKESVMAYGVEIWGWEEKVELEKIMMDYIRWIFSIDFCTL
ncbi:uncharacterized protein LOC112457185, partial [Temnothorax curvispinosus]|uniref:Uncharacterized protein LOC112457185 n=1 Tax=Temnothorax curvispinosus TaxID=300111 RepID=A0A6J1Q321_9HYME